MVSDPHVGNPADDSRGFTRPLVKALRRHVDQLAKSIPASAGTRSDDLARRTRIAGAWVYLSTITAWAEDHGLIDPWLRKGLAGMPGRFTSSPRPVVALAQAMAALTVHPATQWLMHPQYVPDLHAGTPSDEAVEELARWWCQDAPPLAYEVDAGPPSISGWIVGDLLQAVTDDRRLAYALAQTPWWVADGILDLTLLPACAEFASDRLVRTIDPTCGTGHFMIRTMEYLWEWYTTGTLTGRSVKPLGTATGGTPSEPDDALTRLVASVDGVEIDPLTAAVARLRCTVYAAYLRTGRPVRLDRIPRALIPRVGVADSLLLGEIPHDQYAGLHPKLAALPGASFTGGDWDWPTTSAPAQRPPAIPAPVVINQQLDLFAGVLA